MHLLNVILRTCLASADFLAPSIIALPPRPLLTWYPSAGVDIVMSKRVAASGSSSKKRKAPVADEPSAAAAPATTPSTEVSSEADIAALLKLCQKVGKAAVGSMTTDSAKSLVDACKPVLLTNASVAAAFCSAVYNEFTPSDDERRTALGSTG